MLTELAPDRSGRSGQSLVVDATRTPGLLRYAWRGPAPTPRQLGELRARMVTQGFLRPGVTGLLIDMRGLTSLPSYEELRSIMRQAQADRMAPRAVAFVAGAPEQYGVGRQSEMLLPNGVLGGVFEDEAEAVRWLGEVTR